MSYIAYHEQKQAQETPNRAELKPCPFCGGKELSEAQHKQYGMSLRYTIKCLKCMGEMTRTTKQKAENAWNRRAEDGK